MITVEFEEIRKNLKRRGFVCGIWQDPPQQEWNDFIHSEDEIIVLISGEIEISIGTNKIYPKINEEVLIPAKSTHSIKNISHQSNKWLYGYHLTKK